MGVSDIFGNGKTEAGAGNALASAFFSPIKFVEYVRNIG